jgi:hypothetical protein
MASLQPSTNHDSQELFVLCLFLQPFFSPHVFSCHKDFNLRQGDVAKVFTYIVLVVAILKFITMLKWVGGLVGGGQAGEGGGGSTTNI